VESFNCEGTLIENAKGWATSQPPQVASC
jgi:hypothetical protein